MKKLMGILMSGLFVVSSQAAVCTWDGGGALQEWNDPLNWSEDLVPGPGDEVILDNRFISDAYLVRLPPGDVAVSVKTLTIRPGPGISITLVLPEENVSPVGFRATGAGDAVILYDRAVFINSSGCDVSSTPVAVMGDGWFRINNGGRYVHRTARSATEYLVSRLSTEPGTESGVFEFDVPVASYIVSLSNRTFGSLELSSSRYALPVTYRGSGGSPLLIRGDLVLHPAASFALGMSGEITVGGNLAVGAGCLLNLQTADNNNRLNCRGSVDCNGDLSETGNGSPVVELNGNAMQQLNVSGRLLNSVTLRINNMAGVTLMAPLFIQHALDLMNGKVFTSPLNLLTLAEQATCSGSSPTSFVDGPLKAIGAGDRWFPVGTGQIAASAEILRAGTGSPTDETTVTYHRENPTGAVGNQYDLSGGPIDHVSQVEYWTVEGTGTGLRRVAIKVHEASFSRDLSHTFIAHDGAGGWINDGGAVREGPVIVHGFETGIIEALQVVNGSFNCTLATDRVSADNPLPVEFIDVELKKDGPTMATITWTVATPEDSGMFRVERMPPQGSPGPVETIARLQQESGRAMYTSTGVRLMPGVNRFRIAATSPRAEIVYSKIVGALAGRPGESDSSIRLMSIFPMPVRSSMNVLINGSGISRIHLLRLLITDANGSTRQQINLTGNSLSNPIPLSLEHLQPGIYFITGFTEQGQTNSIRFLHQ